MRDGSSVDLDSMDLVISDPSHLTALNDRMRSIGGISMVRTAVGPGPGELGGHDILTAVASSGLLIAVVKMLPDFLRSRRSGIHIETTVKGQKFILDATNVDDVMPILVRLLDD
jgi:hypothetical protein